MSQKISLIKIMIERIAENSKEVPLSRHLLFPNILAKRIYKP
jgi:hypothetical protein